MSKIIEAQKLEVSRTATDEYTSNETDVEEQSSGNFIQQILWKRNLHFINRQLWSVSPIIVGEFGFGYLNKYAVLYRIQLQHFDSKGKYSLLYASLYPYFPIIGIVINVVLMVKYGYRKAMLFLYVTSLMAVCCWLISPSFNMFSTGLSFKSIAFESKLPIHMGYVTEVMESDVRSFISLFVNFMHQVGGTLGQYSPETIHPNVVMTGMCALWFFLCMMLTTFVTESTAWLLRNEPRRLARKRFLWLYGRTEDSLNRYDDIIRDMIDNEPQHLHNVIRAFFSKSFLKSMLIILLLSTVKGLQSHSLVTRYVTRTMYDNVLEETKGDTKAAEAARQYYYNIDKLLELLANGILLIVTVCAVRRRSIFLVLSACSSVILFIPLFIFSSSNINVRISINQTVAFFVVYVLIQTMGSGIIPDTLVAEFFPQDLRIYGSSFVSLYLCFSKHIVNIDHDDHAEHVDSQINLRKFWLFWSAGTVCVVVLYFILPDTDNLSLLEIEDLITFDPWMQPIRNGRDDEDVGYSSTKSSSKDKAETDRKTELSTKPKSIIGPSGLNPKTNERSLVESA